MSTASDRRAPEVSRIPFDGMVEIGGSLGPSFEAQAVNLSEEGMHLRTAYLPEVGQPVTCRFDAGQGMVVVAAGEVLWKDDMGNGGEFGIRFTNLDHASTESLHRIIGMVEDGHAVKPPRGKKVRLHIDGLASPMRARVKAAHGSSVTAFSELGFLQVGKQLDLEDASTGTRRPALIDRVDVDIEAGTRIPQLVVTLRYDDAEAHAADMANSDQGGADAADTDEEEMPPEVAQASSHAGSQRLVSSTTSSADDEMEDAPDLKSSFARNAAKVTPALERWAKRAKTTMALLAARASAKRGGPASDVEIPLRRTTAPAPGGGLHTSGRKVVRGEVEEPASPEVAESKHRFPISRKKMALGGAVGLAAILGLVAMRKPAPSAPVAAAPTTESSAAAAPAPAPAPAPVLPMPVAPSGEMLGANDPIGAAGAAMGADPVQDVRPGKVTPFGNGPVSHGNVLKIKMDGPVSSIQGASQPSGFTVAIPGRKSLDPAGPLAAKDPRIAAIRVSNEPSGAELTVTFKDGVPNYLVKARGDVLEMHLAKPGRAGDKAPEAHAKPRRSKKHH